MITNLSLFSCFFLLIICSACGTKNPVVQESNTASVAQQKLQELMKKFAADFEAGSVRTRDQVFVSYSDQLDDLLNSHPLDSMVVSVKKVRDSSRSVFTHLTLGKMVEFKYTMKFLENITPKQESLYQFMKGLVPGRDTMINLSYMGSYKLKAAPGALPVFLIYAFPSPLGK